MYVPARLWFDKCKPVTGTYHLMLEHENEDNPINDDRIHSPQYKLVSTRILVYPWSALEQKSVLRM